MQAGYRKEASEHDHCRRDSRDWMMMHLKELWRYLRDRIENYLLFLLFLCIILCTQFGWKPTGLHMHLIDMSQCELVISHTSAEAFWLMPEDCLCQAVPSLGWITKMSLPCYLQNKED